MNETAKVVVSTTLIDPAWENTSVDDGSDAATFAVAETRMVGPTSSS